jgi:outer membrane lipoprotein SlyB
MAKIIAGRFETRAEAQRAADGLRNAGFAARDVSAFYLNPPGQHAEYPIGGDAHHDEGTKESGKTAVAGATVGGVTGLALGAAVGAAADIGVATAVAGLAGAGVGAYVGSLAGGLTGARAGNPEQANVEEPVERTAGMMVAVRADGNEEAVIQALQAQGAMDIERASGEWRDGSWVDFDPRRTPELI